jgi:hypothetical protein
MATLFPHLTIRSGSWRASWRGLGIVGILATQRVN